jgi:fatty acid desaturase
MESVDTAEAKAVRRAAARRQIPERLNCAIAIIILLVYLSLLLGESLLLGRHFWLFGLVVVGFLVSTPTVWGLVHEGIHGRLIRHPSANRAASRVLCVLLGFSFDAVQFGHLMHHRYNGHRYDRPDRAVDAEPAWKNWARHWIHLLGGHYLFTALVSTVAFAPARPRQLALQSSISGQEPDTVAMRHAAVKWFSNPQRMVRIRIDCIVSILLILLSVMRYAAFWPVLALALSARAVIYSTLDNLPHYGVQGRGDAAAKNFSLPRWASFVVLHHNLHRVHHERPDLPWREVPAYFGKADTEGNYLLAAVRQFSGPSRT